MSEKQRPRLFHALSAIINAHQWVQPWLRTGMICCSTPERTFQASSLEMMTPSRLQALGCGGWDRDGSLHWAGLDLDVGHGEPSYPALTDAINAAERLRDFVGGAAEIRLFKSGQGVHVRVALATPIAGGRECAARIAKWLSRTLVLHADAAPLGRQNFWFWASQLAPHAFELITPCERWWTPPPQAAKETVTLVAQRPPAMHTATLLILSRRTREFLEHGAPAGQRNYRLFIAACDFCGSGLREEQAIKELLPVSLWTGLPEHEARRTIRSAYGKPRQPAARHTA